MNRYRYVGPPAVWQSVRNDPPGTPIRSRTALQDWLRKNGIAAGEPNTFVVTIEGVLQLADRHSEHVACAAGADVLAAGEMAFEDGEAVFVSNQSTGYCPDPDCWPAIANALDEAGIDRSDGLTAAFIFRRCTGCNQRNLVKDDWWICAVCDAPLSRTWNFADE